MSADPILLAKAEQIRDATNIGENTALRVGGLLVDIVNALGSDSDAFSALSSFLENYNAVLSNNDDNIITPDRTHVIDLHQSRLVFLDSMGSELDGESYTLQNGDVYYQNGFIMVYPSGGYAAKTGVLYINKRTNKFYEWTGAAMSEIAIAGSGGGGSTVTISEYDGYVNIDIVDNTPAVILSTQTLVTSGDNKTATFKVSGLNLTGPIHFSVSNAYLSVSPNNISPDGNGNVAETTVTVTYSGNADADDIITVSAPGVASQDIAFTYQDIPVPTIIASPATLSFSIAPNSTEQKTLTVTGANLTGSISAAVSGTNSSLFTLSANSLQSSGGTLTVTYSPTAEGSHSATLTLSSTGADSVSVSLGGTAENAITSDAEGKFTKVVNGKTLYLKRRIVDGAKTTEVEVHQSNYANEWNSTVADTYSGDIVIPATVVVDGVTCNITRIATNAFRFDKKKTQLTSVTLPEGITTIGMYFLYQAQAVTSVIIPSTVTTISGQFCCSATNLVTIDMRCAKNANFQTTWGNANSPYCRGCSKLTSFVIPDKVTEIINGSYGSFENCPLLTQITLGTDMDLIRGLFQFATSVTSIYCRGTVPPKINAPSSTTAWISSTVYQNAQVYVPTDCKQVYLDVDDGYANNGKVWNPFESYHPLIEYNPD